MGTKVVLIILVCVFMIMPTLNPILGEKGTDVEVVHIDVPTPPGPLAETSFSIVLLPDTQYYVQSYPQIFDNQTEWIVNNTQEWNIKYMLHEGDITNRNTPPQWDNANKSIRILDGKVPYALAMGNHDTGTNGNAATRDTTYFNQYFPYYEFENWSTFGGFYDPWKMDNTYHLFEAGGEKFLVFATEFGPRNDVLRWANEVAENYTDRFILMTTHAYTAPNGARISSQPYGVQNQPGGANYGTGMWNRFVRNHQSFINVYSGHVWGNGKWRQEAAGDNGNTVFEMLADYQDHPQGGEGYLRIVTFDTVAETIRVQSYSPWLDSWLTADKHNFTLNYKRWWYFNDLPAIKNNIQSFDLEEDDAPGYLDLDGFDDPTTGIFEDPNQANGDDLSFSIWTGNKWCVQGDVCNFESENLTARPLVNGTLEVIPKENMFGSDPIILNATDTMGGSITKSMTLNIAPVNDGPTMNVTADWIYGTPKPVVADGSLKVLEDDPVNITLTAFDHIEPGDTLRFYSNASVDNAPFFSVDEDTGQITFTPLNEHVGTYQLNVSVDDGGSVNNTDRYEFELEVINVNDPPIITTTDIEIAIEDEWYTVIYDATDEDPTEDPFSWLLFTDARFLEMDPTTGVLSGFPTNDDVGEYSVRINVTDGNEGYDEQIFDLMVRNTNDPPMIFEPPSDFAFDEDTIDTSIELGPWFTDMDEDILTYRADDNQNIKVTITIDGNVTLEPNKDWCGEETLTFYASDTAIEVSDVINITVRPVNDAPTDAKIEFIGVNFTVGGAHLAKGTGSDVDLEYGDELRYFWSSNLSGSLGVGQQIDLSLKAGLHTITLEVSDEAGAKTETTSEVLVHPKATPPPPPPPPNGGGDGDEPFIGSSMFYGLIGMIIAIVVIVMILMMMKMRRRPGPEIGPMTPLPTEEGAEMSTGPPPMESEGPGPPVNEATESSISDPGQQVDPAAQDRP